MPDLTTLSRPLYDRRIHHVRETYREADGSHSCAACGVNDAGLTALLAERDALRVAALNARNALGDGTPVARELDAALSFTPPPIRQDIPLSEWRPAGARAVPDA